jgi:HK97 family phage prohead protease
MYARSDGHGSPVQLEEKGVSESEDAWTVRGYAAVFNNKDLGGDVILPGAFADSLRTHGLPLILFQHKVEDVPVGTCVDAKEDRRGLHITAELPKDDEFVRGRLVPQLRRRGLKGMSIGYRALETEKRKEDGARLLKRIRLFECSFVSMPMNPQAGVETIKTMSSEELAHTLEQLSRAAREITALARLEPVSELADFTKSVKAFVDEVRRDRPQLRDPIARAETAMLQAQARLERLRRAASR